MAYTREDKNRVAEELERQLGNVTLTCRACGVPRNTFDYWVAHDEKFAKQVREAKRVSVDFCANKMFQLANQGNFKALKYILSTLGRDFGWGPENGTIINNNVTAGEIKPPAIIFSSEEEAEE